MQLKKIKSDLERDKNHGDLDQQLEDALKMDKIIQQFDTTVR